MAAQPEALLAFSDAVLVDSTGDLLSRSRWRVSGFGPREWNLMARDPLGQMLARQVVSGITSDDCESRSAVTGAASRAGSLLM